MGLEYRRNLQNFPELTCPESAFPHFKCYGAQMPFVQGRTIKSEFP